MSGVGSDDYHEAHEEEGIQREDSAQSSGVPHRTGFSAGSSGRHVVSPDAGNDAGPGAEQRRQDDGTSQPDHDPGSSAVNVAAYLIENHLHLPLTPPSLVEIERMRSNCPELYHAYVAAIDRQSVAESRARLIPFDEPAKIARRGQVAGLAAVFGVLSLAAFVFWLGHPVAGTVLAAIDVVALAAVFANPRNG